MSTEAHPRVSGAGKRRRKRSAVQWTCSVPVDLPEAELAVWLAGKPGRWSYSGPSLPTLTQPLVRKRYNAEEHSDLREALHGPAVPNGLAKLVTVHTES